MSPGGGGWGPSGWASPWECQAAQSRQARPEGAQEASWSTAKGGTLTMPPHVVRQEVERRDGVTPQAGRLVAPDRGVGVQHLAPGVFEGVRPPRAAAWHADAHPVVGVLRAVLLVLAVVVVARGDPRPRVAQREQGRRLAVLRVRVEQQRDELCLEGRMQ